MTTQPTAQVLVAGAPGIASALTESGRFVRVLTASSTAELRDHIKAGLLGGSTPANLVFLFADTTEQNTPGTTLGMLVGKLTASSWRVGVLELSPAARELVAANPSAGLITAPFTTNNVLGSLAGMGLALEPLAEEWGFATLEPSDPSSVQTAIADAAAAIPQGWGEVAAAVNPPTPSWGPAPQPASEPAPQPAAQPTPRQEPVAHPAWGPAPQAPEQTAPVSQPSWGPAPQPASEPAPQPAAQSTSQPAPAAQPSWSPAPQAPEQPSPVQEQAPTGWNTAPAPQTQPSWGGASQAESAPYWSQGSGPQPLNGYTPAPQILPPRRGMVIPICVAKGGAGKSTLTLNLAVYLALRLRADGRRVCVVDANFQQADISNLISVYTPNIATLAANLADLNPENIQKHVVFRNDLNTAFLLGPALTEESNPRWITPQLYTAAIDSLRVHYDYIFVDSPVAEFHHDLFSDCLLPSADFMVVPVNPDYRSIHNTDRWLRAITQSKHEGGQGFDPRRAGIVLNKQTDGVGADESQVRIELANWQWIGAIPESKAWQKAANEEEVVATQNYPELASAFTHILYSVTGEEALREELTSTAKPSRSARGILSKLARVKK